MFKKAMLALFVLAFAGFMASYSALAGHNFSTTHNPNTCGECHNVEHTGDQSAKTIFPGSAWLYIGADELDITTDWTDYASWTLKSTPSIYNTPSSRVCLKCHGKTSFKTSSRMAYVYVDHDGHYGHPIGMEITDSLISQRSTRTPEVLQDEMTTLTEMQDNFYFDGADNNVMACATCHGYIHRGDKGPYGEFLTFSFEVYSDGDDATTDYGGVICGKCHSGKWLSLTSQ